MDYKFTTMMNLLIYSKDGFNYARSKTNIKILFVMIFFEFLIVVGVSRRRVLEL